MKTIYTGETKKKFDSLPRTNKIHDECGHKILDSRLTSCYTCDEIACNNCCSFTVLHLWQDQIEKSKFVLLKEKILDLFKRKTK